MIYAIANDNKHFFKDKRKSIGGVIEDDDYGMKFICIRIRWKQYFLIKKYIIIRSKY